MEVRVILFLVETFLIYAVSYFMFDETLTMLGLPLSRMVWTHLWLLVKAKSKKISQIRPYTHYASNE